MGLSKAERWLDWFFGACFGFAVGWVAALAVYL